jgi:hypothetical protein
MLVETLGIRPPAPEEPNVLEAVRCIPARANRCDCPMHLEGKRCRKLLGRRARRCNKSYWERQKPYWPVPHPGPHRRKSAVLPPPSELETKV